MRTVTNKKGVVRAYTPGQQLVEYIPKSPKPEDNYDAAKQAIESSPNGTTIYCDEHCEYRYHGSPITITGKRGIRVKNGLFTRRSGLGYSNVFTIQDSEYCGFCETCFDGQAGIFFESKLPVEVGDVGATNPNPFTGSVSRVFQILNSKACYLDKCEVHDHAGKVQFVSTGGIHQMLFAYGLFIDPSSQLTKVSGSTFDRIGYSAINDYGRSTHILNNFLSNCSHHAIASNTTDKTVIRGNTFWENQRFVGYRSGCNIFPSGGDDRLDFLDFSDNILRHEYDHLANADLWQSGATYQQNDVVYINGAYWCALNGGNTGGTSPSGGFGTTVTTGGVTWQYCMNFTGPDQMKIQRTRHAIVKGNQFIHGKNGPWNQTRSSLGIQLENEGDIHLTDNYMSGSIRGLNNVDLHLYLENNCINDTAESNAAIVSDPGLLQIVGGQMKYSQFAIRPVGGKLRHFASENVRYDSFARAGVAMSFVFFDPELPAKPENVQFDRSNLINNQADGDASSVKAASPEGRLIMSTSGEDGATKCYDSTLAGQQSHPTPGSTTNAFPGLACMDCGVVKNKTYTNSTPSGGNTTSDVEEWRCNGTTYQARA